MRAKITQRTIDVGHRTLGGIKQPLPGDGQADATRPACEYARVQALFELAHTVTQRTHRDMHGLGRPGQVALARHVDEGIQKVQRYATHVEFYSSPCWKSFAFPGSSVHLACVILKLNG